MGEYVPTVVFDFDGVVHSYKSGWKGVDIIPDPPVPGIAEAIAAVRAAGYRAVIVSTRSAYISGHNAIVDYLHHNNIVVDSVESEKPPAVVYVDDRAICFDGDPTTLLNKIQSFKPWHQQELIPAEHSPANLPFFVGQKVWTIESGKLIEDRVERIYDEGFGWMVITGAYCYRYSVAKDLNTTLFYDEEIAKRVFNSL